MSNNPENQIENSNQAQDADRPFGAGSVLYYQKNVVLNITSVATTIPVSYPSAFFVDNEKPIINLRYKNNSLSELTNAVYGGLDKCTLSVGVANAYLHRVLQEVTVQNVGVWKSYGQVIAEDGVDIHPFSMVTIRQADAGALGDTATCPAEFKPALAFTLCTLYRLIHAGNDDYRNVIITNMKTQPEGARAAEKFQIEGLVSDCNGWISDRNFTGLIAAIDMFYHKFPNADYANLRFGTVTSRFRDCSGLTSFHHAMTYFGIDHPVDLMKWIFTVSVARDVRRLFSNKEELDVLYSYFPYQMEFKLVIRSAYSATINQNLYYWANAICAIQGDVRSKNARFLLKSDAISTRTHALAAGYLLSTKPVHADRPGGDRTEPDPDNSIYPQLNSHGLRR